MRSREQRDLHLGRAGVGVVEAVLGDDAGLRPVDDLGHAASSVGRADRGSGGFGPRPMAATGAAERSPSRRPRRPAVAAAGPRRALGRLGQPVARLERPAVAGRRCSRSSASHGSVGVRRQDEGVGLVEGRLDLVERGVAGSRPGLPAAPGSRAVAEAARRAARGTIAGQRLGVLQQPRVGGAVDDDQLAVGPAGGVAAGGERARRGRGRRGSRTSGTPLAAEPVEHPAGCRRERRIDTAGPISRHGPADVAGERRGRRGGRA